MLSLERVGKTYPNGVHALDAITLCVVPGEIVAAILSFAVLGKITDAIVVLVSAPFLRWQDTFRPATES